MERRVHDSVGSLQPKAKRDKGSANGSLRRVRLRMWV